MENEIELKVTKYIKDLRKYLRKKDMIEDIDSTQIDNIEDSYRTFLYAKEDIENEGLFIKNRFGDKISNPAIKVSNDAKIQMNKALELMGITHKQRYKKTEVVEEESPIEKFMKL